MAIADLCIQHQKSCVLLGNKSDLLTPQQRELVPNNVADRLPMLWYAPVVVGSALKGEGLEEAMDLVAEAARWRAMRVPRRRLNDLFKRAQVSSSKKKQGSIAPHTTHHSLLPPQVLRPLPMIKAPGGHKSKQAAAARAGRLRVKWVVQAPTEAPTFVFHMNRKGDLHPSDMRWLENTVRSQWAFTGTPLRMVLQVRDTRRKRRIREGTGSKGYQGSNRKSRAELIGRR